MAFKPRALKNLMLYDELLGCSGSDRGAGVAMTTVRGCEVVPARSPWPGPRQVFRWLDLPKDES